MGLKEFKPLLLPAITAAYAFAMFNDAFVNISKNADTPLDKGIMDQLKFTFIIIGPPFFGALWQKKPVKISKMVRWFSFLSFLFHYAGLIWDSPRTMAIGYLLLSISVVSLFALPQAWINVLVDTN